MQVRCTNTRSAQHPAAHCRHSELSLPTVTFICNVPGGGGAQGGKEPSPPGTLTAGTSAGRMGSRPSQSDLTVGKHRALAERWVRALLRWGGPCAEQGGRAEATGLHQTSCGRVVSPSSRATHPQSHPTPGIPFPVVFPFCQMMRKKILEDKKKKMYLAIIPPPQNNLLGESP